MLLTLHHDIWTIFVYFDNMVSQIYRLELQLDTANTSYTKAAFLDLHLSISNEIVSTKIMINAMTLILKLSISHFLMVMFLAVYPMESISLNSFVLQEHQAMRVADFKTRNKLLTQKLLKQGYQYHKLRLTFSKLL